MKLLTANNAQTVLASGINASATSLTVATGKGSEFPTPVSGTSAFLLTLTDAATMTITEIVLVTAVSGDTFTITRAQEGTTAVAWSANDIAMNTVTAGTVTAYLAQLDSPAFTGTPTAPTATDGINTTQIANMVALFAATRGYGLGVPGSTPPTYVYNPISGSNVSATRVINALSSDTQSTVDSPVSGQRFGGWHVGRDIRPAQFGVSGQGSASGTSGASFWYRGFSTTTATASDWKQLADVASPTFTGTPAAPTAAAGTNTTQLATTAFVTTAVGAAGYGRLLKRTVISATQTFNYQSATTMAFVQVVGAGGGGAGAEGTGSTSYVSGGSGGGGGGYAEVLITSAASLVSTIATIGSAGSAGSGAAGGSSTNGGSGGTTSFGSLCAASGGGGGAYQTTSSGSTLYQQLGGIGGAGTIGDRGSRGNPGGRFLSTSVANSTAGEGGASAFSAGYRGPGGGTASAGVAGTQGAGGSGAINATGQTAGLAGGAGGPGMIIVWEYA